MASSVEERLLDLVVSKLAGITVGNGYEETVLAANIHRGQDIAPQEIGASDCPAACVRIASISTRWHLRGAEEILMELDLIGVVDAAGGDEALADLMADFRKLVYANKFWNDGSENLARRSWVIEDERYEVEVAEATLSGRVRVGILTRVDRSNPYSLKAV
jgi:hypothetical protein